MLSPLSLLFLGKALTISARALSLPATIRLTNTGLASGNVSLNADLPDPRFSISPIFDVPLLAIDPCLINVLYLMSEVAYGDFTQRHQPRTYRAPGYGEVEVVTDTAMTARFLIWGAWLAVEYMIHDDRFHNVVWTLRWEDIILGTIKIQASSPRLNLPGSSEVQGPDVPSLQNATTNTKTTAIAPTTSPNSFDTRFALLVSSFADSKALAKTELFMACYTGLLHCAQYPAAAPMQPFGIASPVGDVALHIVRAAGGGPGLAYSYLIRALSHLPLYLLQDPRGFREINFDMSLDGVLAAKGAITKGRV